jgi:hypothetical protein
VFVFDVDVVASQEQFEAIIPGIGFVHHSPVVGYWQRGQLVEKACGFQGREIVSRLFGLDPKAILERRTPSPV